MKYYSLICLLLLSSCLYIPTSPKPPTEEDEFALSIGMAYQGGIIAYILLPYDLGYVSGETHGLITATEDQSGSISWLGFGGEVITIGTGTAVGTGQANTTAIVASQGAGSYSAQVCNDYINTDTGTGVYSDWYLPSKDELIKVCYKLHWDKDDPVGGFADEYYWSSSESSVYSNTAVWYVNFNDGHQYYTNKMNMWRVRAIRAF